MSNESVTHPFTPSDIQQMKAEGWCISTDSDGIDQIQRIESLAIFPHDEAAVASVYNAARHGSDLHRRVLAYLIAPPFENGRTYPLFLSAPELAAVGYYINRETRRLQGRPEVAKGYIVLNSVCMKLMGQLDTAINDPTFTG